MVRIIQNAFRASVIVPSLESGYLAMEYEPARVNETKKPYIGFRTRVISSIYPESGVLLNLSHVLNDDGSVNPDSNPEQVLQVIQRIPDALCVSFFPPILNYLFKIMANAPDDVVAGLSVRAVISVVSK